MKTKTTREKTSNQKPAIVIEGMEKGRRVDSRVLEERLQQAVESGHRNIEVKAYRPARHRRKTVEGGE